MPERGGTLDELRQLVNVATDDDFRLLVGWLLASLYPRGPYPILILNGEQGSGKSTQARLLRMLVDPNAAPIRMPPREERDLLVAARNSRVVCLDNVSYVREWLADGLCRLSTGGGFSARQLYTDLDEVLFEVMRPALLNGIPDLATRPDLADRAISLVLPTISEDRRMSEYDFWQTLNAAKPRILGVLLDALSCAVRRLPEIQLDHLPRMADFARLLTAAEEAFGWEQGSFLNAYSNNQAEAIESTIEADPVAQAVMDLMRGGLGADFGSQDVEPWSGTATILLQNLEGLVSESGLRSRSWPKQANTLSNRLRRAAPALRTNGIEVEFGDREGRARHRVIRISKVR